MKNYGMLLFVLIISATLDITGQSPEQGEEQVQLIRISTTLGDMVLKLYNETPVHRDNMIKLINEGYFNGQLFHRVIKDFMIQGGDPESAGAQPGVRLGNGGPGYTLPAEFNKKLFHKKGALAAARMGDQVNPDKESSGSQFYLVQGRVFTDEELEALKQSGMGEVTEEAAEVYKQTGGTPHLDGSYTVFGEIVEGMDVLDRIAAVPTDRFNRPLTDVVYTISLVR